MSFKVKLFSGAPDYETLHVAKLTCFPLEKRDYKPYSQARICFAEDGLHVQLLAFEAKPLPDSAMKAVFQLQPDLESLVLTLCANGHFHACLASESAQMPLNASVHTFTGEDLQGVYWGGNVLVPQAELDKCFPDFKVQKNSTFTGNLYKLCENPTKPHYGCFYPADFEKPLVDPSNLGEFIIIDF
ncbi:hypothetical protein V6615_11070 [Oscillospiraceae bacterium PP1C4]